MKKRIGGNVRGLAILVASGAMVVWNAALSAQGSAAQPQVMPSGQMITPLAPKGAQFSQLNPGLADLPSYTAGQAVKTAISPDGNTLLILTSGFNRISDAQGHRVARDSDEYVFIYDIGHGQLRQEQALQVPNTFFGIAFAPSGNQFYVSGGVDDDFHVFSNAGGQWTETGAPIPLGHHEGVGIHQRPTVANVPDGAQWQEPER